MLFASVTGFAAASSELVDLRANVSRCIRLRNSDAFTQDDQGASNNLFCSSQLEALQKIEKLTFLEVEDNALLFDIAADIVLAWRGMGLGTTLDRNEVAIRRIAADKLGDVNVVGNVPGAANQRTAAIQALSTAARQEDQALVLLTIINSLRVLLKDGGVDVPASTRTEAFTTLKTLTQNANIGVQQAAQVTLKLLEPTIEIGPVTVTPLPKQRSKFFVPIIVTTAAAVVATGVIWYVARRPISTALSAGPLRRRTEAQLRRRQAAR